MNILACMLLAAVTVARTQGPGWGGQSTGAVTLAVSLDPGVCSTQNSKPRQCPVILGFNKILTTRVVEVVGGMVGNVIATIPLPADTDKTATTTLAIPAGTWYAVEHVAAPLVVKANGTPLELRGYWLLGGIGRPDGSCEPPCPLRSLGPGEVRPPMAQNPSP